jgi:integrase
MPRLSNLNPKYRHHRPSGQAVVTHCGKDFYLGPWKSKGSKAEYDRLIGEWLANGRRLAANKHATLKVIELAAAFWTHAKTYYAPKEGGSASDGELSNFKTIISLLTKNYGHTLVADFGPLSLKALRGAMIAAGWSRQYTNAQTKRVRRIFKWAVAQEMAEPRVLEGLRAVDGLRAGRTEARETEPVQPVPDLTLTKTSPHLSATAEHMVNLQLLTGARSGEVCAMRGYDVDTSGPVWLYKPIAHKTLHHGHKRIIYLGPKAKAIVAKYLKPSPQAFLFSPADAEAERRAKLHEQRVANKDATPLTCGNAPGTNRKRRPRRCPGERYTVASYRRAIARACEKAFAIPADLCEPRGKTARAAAVEAGLMTAEKIAERKKMRRVSRADHTWHPHQLRHNAARRACWDVGEKGAVRFRAAPYDGAALISVGDRLASASEGARP